jgi:hypothetical protein
VSTNFHNIPKTSFYSKLFVYCQDIGFSLEFASPTGEKIVSLISFPYCTLIGYFRLSEALLIFIAHSYIQSVRLVPSPCSPLFSSVLYFVLLIHVCFAIFHSDGG